jgi:hypothetical protein
MNYCEIFLPFWHEVRFILVLIGFVCFDHGLKDWLTAVWKWISDEFKTFYFF